MMMMMMVERKKDHNIYTLTHVSEGCGTTKRSEGTYTNA
jgi:hypothetical protein